MNIKQRAIDTLRYWANEILDKYEEPTRKGTQRGDKIGFSRTKKYAAILCNLHPALKLKEIASLAGVSPGTLQVWRNENEFHEEIFEQAELFAKGYTQNLEKAFYNEEESRIEGMIQKLKIVLCLSPYIQGRICGTVSEMLDSLSQEVEGSTSADPAVVNSHHQLSIAYKRMVVECDLNLARTRRQKRETVKKHLDSIKVLADMQMQELRARTSVGEGVKPWSQEEEVKGLLFESMDVLSDA